MKRRERAKEDAGLNGSRARRNGAPAKDGERPVPIWEVIAALGRSVPPEELERLPTDLARNVDHYLYGAPKRG